jgi:hypothetical protein
VPLGTRDYFDFLAFMVRHGLSMATIFTILRQLFGEYFGRPRWQRVEIMDRIQWDLFRSYYDELKPDFSTFFLNSTAHLQHKFWRNMDPEVFDVKPSVEEQRECGDAILFGYQAMDRLLGKIVNSVDENTTIIFCTGLSQQACTIYDDFGGKKFYRPLDIGSLITLAGVVGSYEAAPVMSEQFHVRFMDAESAKSALDRLSSLKIGDRNVLDVSILDKDLFLGCKIFDQVDKDTIVTIESTEMTHPFFDLFYQAESTKSGMHHPDGMLWIRTPDKKHVHYDGRVSLRRVAPTVLSLLEIPIPDSMGGRSLFDT